MANAGITKTLTMPVGAEALKFRFKFSTAGDGDFLEVRFGQDHLLYLGLDATLSRDGFTLKTAVEGPRNTQKTRKERFGKIKAFTPSVSAWIASCS